jgi:hypothetical protein
MARIIHTTGLEISGSQFTQISNDLTASFNITGSGDVIGGQFIIDKGAATGSSFQVISDGQLLIANKGGGQINKISLKAMEIDDSNSNSTSFRLGGPIRVGQGTADSTNHQHEMSGSVNITGSMNAIGVNIMSSSRIDPKITSILTENDSFPFIQNVTTTGPNFRMNLVDEGSGKAYISLGNQAGGFAGTGFNAHYATGSNASEGEIIMSLGKNGSAGALQDRFIVQSEPGPIATNGESELTLSVGGPKTGRRQVLGNVQEGTGEFAAFAAGIDNEFGRKRFVSLEYSSNSTSSQAGFFSSSLAGTGVPNFNTNAIPFGIVAGGSQTTDLTNTVFFIDRGGSVGATVPVTASFQISRGGSIDMEGHITASGNISGSSTTTLSVGGDITGGGRGTFTNRVSALTDLVTPKILNNTSANNGTVLIDDGLTISGNVTASSNISASGDVIGLSGSFSDLSVSNLAAIGDSQTDTINITGNSLFMLEENNNGTFKIRENATQVDILAIQADDAPRAIFAFDPTHYDNDVDGQGRIGLGVATASIASKLHINLLTGSNAPTSIVRLDATGNDNIMFVSSSGNVGIGTGTPDELLTVAGNISASGDIIGNNGSFTTSITTPEISGNTEITGDLQVVKITADGRISTTSHITASGTGLFGSISTTSHITASGTGLFQAGKPIKTHTTSPISASLANAGRYHIVGGTLTASIVLDSTAPIGAEYEFFQTSSVGQFLFESASGTTVISKNGSLRLAQQGSSAVLKKVSTTTFHLMGDLT